MHACVTPSPSLSYTSNQLQCTSLLVVYYCHVPTSDAQAYNTHHHIRAQYASTMKRAVNRVASQIIYNIPTALYRHDFVLSNSIVMYLKEKTSTIIRLYTLLFFYFSRTSHKLCMCRAIIFSGELLRLRAFTSATLPPSPQTFGFFYNFVCCYSYQRHTGHVCFRLFVYLLYYHHN